MSSRATIAACVAGAFLFSVSLGTAASDTTAAQPAITMPFAGNVSVARLTIMPTPAGGTTGTPRLTLASRSGMPPGSFIVGAVGRSARPGRFEATVVAVNPNAQPVPGTSQSAKVIPLRLSPGFSLAGQPQIARNVLYANAAPSFKLVAGGAASVMAGETPAKLPIARIVRDAQLLALERSVPLADMGLLGLQYVAAQLPRAPSTTLQVTIGLSRLSQVNAVELRFANGIRVTKVSGPPDTDGILVDNAVQLIASQSFFKEGVAYSFKLELSRAPRKGEFVTVRASEHYFEGSLPLTERFVFS